MFHSNENLGEMCFIVLNILKISGQKDRERDKKTDRQTE